MASRPSLIWIAQSRTQPLNWFIDAKGPQMRSAAAMMNSVAGSVLDLVFSFGPVFVLIENIVADKNKVTILRLQMRRKIVKYLYKLLGRYSP